MNEAIRVFVESGLLPIFDTLSPVIGGGWAFIVTISAPMAALGVVFIAASHLDRWLWERKVKREIRKAAEAAADRLLAS